MSNIDNYTEEYINYINDYKEISEDEITRYLYINLGKRITFDTEWIFENPEQLSKIYYESGTKEKANRYIPDKKWSLICRDIAFLLSYMGQKIGINIEIIKTEANRFNPYAHVYNKVTRKDGKIYYLDLYNDLSNINMHMKTEFFGMTEDPNKAFFKDEELEQMDLKIGYINKDNYYTNEYLYFLKNQTKLIDSTAEQLRLILENPFPLFDSEAGYFERKMYLINAINFIIGLENRRKWDWMDCYHFEGVKLIPKEIIFVEEDERIAFFEYINELQTFIEISKEQLAEYMASRIYLPSKYQNSKTYPWFYELKEIAESKRSK